jgi:hypothetical protein
VRAVSSRHRRRQADDDGRGVSTERMIDNRSFSTIPSHLRPILP